MGEPQREPPLETVALREAGNQRKNVPRATGRFRRGDRAAFLRTVRQMAAHEVGPLRFRPGIACGHHRLERLRMRAHVMIRFHEILHDHFPVERKRHSPTCAHRPRADPAKPTSRRLRAHFRPLFRGNARRRPIEIHEDETEPHLCAKLPQAPLRALEARRFLHLRAGLQPAIEIEGPRMIRAQKQARVAAAGLAAARFGRAMPETGWHDVHAAMRTGA